MDTAVLLDYSEKELIHRRIPTLSAGEVFIKSVENCISVNWTTVFQLKIKVLAMTQCDLLLVLDEMKCGSRTAGMIQWQSLESRFVNVE